MKSATMDIRKPILNNLQIEGIKIKELEKGSIILFAMAIGGNIFNYALQVLMGRMVSVADFGTLNVLTSILFIFTVPANAIILLVSKRISYYDAKNQKSMVKVFLKKCFIVLCLMSLACLVVGTLALPFMALYLNIDNNIYLLLLEIITVLNFFVAILMGILQGFMKFFLLGSLSFVSSLLKLVFSLTLVIIGYNIFGYLLGTILSFIVILSVGSLAVYRYFSEAPENDLVIGIQNEDDLNAKKVIYVTLATTAVTFLAYADIIAVKHFFPSRLSGLYGAAASIGKLIFIASGAISAVMFPILVRQKALKGNPYKAFRRALLYNCAISVLALASFVAVPELIMGFLFGSAYLPATGYIRLLGIAMFPLSMMYVILNYAIATGRIYFTTFSLIAGCIFEYLLISIFHGTVYHIIYIIIFIGSIVFILNYLHILAFQRNENRSGGLIGGIGYE